MLSRFLVLHNETAESSQIHLLIALQRLHYRASINCCFVIRFQCKRIGAPARLIRFPHDHSLYDQVGRASPFPGFSREHTALSSASHPSGNSRPATPRFGSRSASVCFLALSISQRRLPPPLIPLWVEQHPDVPVQLQLELTLEWRKGTGN